ncbi:MAG: carbohydrate kinase family protein [Clostridia bacterium]|nr:carbohydrate kinase family protein [Clostridia bacterium]
MSNLNYSGIAFAGTILTDIIKEISAYPEKGMLVNIKTETRAVGGLVPNTAINLKKIDKSMRVLAIGKVGDDENGKFILSCLNENGIITDNIIKDANHSTSFTDVMSEESTGVRTFFYKKGADAYLDLSEFDVNALNVKIFHIGYLSMLTSLEASDAEYGIVLSRLLSSIRDRCIKTSLDMVSNADSNLAEFAPFVLPQCDYLILNEIEAGKISMIDLSGKVSTDKFLEASRKIMELGVREKVVIHAPEGASILNKDGEFTFLGSFILPKGYIKCSVGAGDSFAAGTLYGIYNDFSDKDILNIASAAAAASLSCSDSISGMLPLEELNLFSKKYERRDFSC